MQRIQHNSWGWRESIEALCLSDTSPAPYFALHCIDQYLESICKAVIDFPGMQTSAGFVLGKPIQSLTLTMNLLIISVCLSLSLSLPIPLTLPPFILLVLKLCISFFKFACRESSFTLCKWVFTGSYIQFFF